MGRFSDWRPVLLSLQTKQYNVVAYLNGANMFSCFLGREHLVWKHGNRTAKLAPQTPANCDLFCQNDLVVIPFKLPMIRPPESPQ